MKIYLLIPFLTLSFFSISQDTEQHPIDIRNQACHDIDSNQTTLGMMQCEWLAYQEWEVEMNHYYDLLIDTLSNSADSLLISSQQDWELYLKSEKNFSSNLYYSEMQGTMWRIINAQNLKDIMKQRALVLKDYYETFTFNP